MDAVEKMSPEDAAKMAAINEKIDARRAGAMNVMPDAPEAAPAPSSAREQLHGNDSFLAKFMPHRKEANGDQPADEAAIEAAAGSIKDEQVAAEAPAPAPAPEAAPAAGGIDPSLTPEQAEARAAGGIAPVMAMPRMEAPAAPAAPAPANEQAPAASSDTDALRKQYEDQLNTMMNAPAAPAAPSEAAPAASVPAPAERHDVPAPAKPSVSDRLTEALEREHAKTGQDAAKPEAVPAKPIAAAPSVAPAEVAPHAVAKSESAHEHAKAEAAPHADADLVKLMERLDKEEADAKQALAAITQKRERFLEAKKKLDALRAQEAAEKQKLEELLKAA
ncbi:MAG TPA: hypothetical protein VFL98_03205 [Candidatus Paceibacterota bacterium]|nr:hypothetical protein [Candidatus Paceibacterota bacterium]